MSTAVRTEWNTKELQEDFKVEYFSLSICVVTRKSDGTKGTLLFDGSPRRYYEFMEETT